MLLKKKYQYPVFLGIMIAFFYFCMDTELLNVQTDRNTWVSIGYVVLAFLIFYFVYVHAYMRKAAQRRRDIPMRIGNQEKAALIPFIILCIGEIILLIGYREWLSSLLVTYYPSQLVLYIGIAPILEELVFRYLLYDCWTREAFGIGRGMIAAVFLCIICHPTFHIQAMILYWFPTILFYFIYENFGIYAAILAHILFNLVAI